MRTIAVAVLGTLLASMSVVVESRPASAQTADAPISHVGEPSASLGQVGLSTKPGQGAAAAEAVGVIIDYEGATGVNLPDGSAEVLEDVREALADDLDASIDTPMAESVAELESGLFAVELENVESQAALAEIVDVLGDTPGVASVEPDWLISVNLEDVAVDGADDVGNTGTRSVKIESIQSGAEWGLDRIDQRGLPLNSSYSYQFSGDGVRVYVVDTGVRSSHSELAGRVVSGYTSIDDGRGWEDCNGHGTHVAGTIAGELYGVAKSATIVPVRVLDCAGSGSNSTVIDGLNWVLADVRSNPSFDAVVNMSLGGPIHEGLDNKVLELVSAGVTVVVASGNEGQNSCYSSPARVAAALTVNASTIVDQDASFSNYGSCSDLYAPGVSIRSAWFTSDSASASLSGTSMAAPHVAGVAAQTLEVNPGISPSAVASLILENATNIGFYGVSGDPDGLLFGGFLSPEDETLEEYTSAPTPNITGSLNVGAVLEAVVGTWVPAPTSFTYQWRRDGGEIPSATASTYTLTADDLGALMSVVVVPVKSGYESTTRTSADTGAVESGIFITSPVPTIAGSAVVGQTLTASLGEWTPTPTTVAYQWLVNGAVLRGATGSTYVVGSRDVGRQISVRVTGSKVSYLSTVRESARTSAVLAGFPFDVSPVPTIAGSAVVGQTLTASLGEWTPTPTTVAYQWLVNGAVIRGATGSTYVVGSRDVGREISVRVTGSKTSYLPAVETSLRTERVLRGFPFEDTSAPTISGSAVVGQTLTASVAEWTPAATLSYQWLSNGRVIRGATGSTYVVGSRDVGREISVRVTGSKTSYVPAVRESARTSAVLAGFPFDVSPVPTIAGSAVVGQVLTASVAEWTPAATLSYQWLSNGRVIRGATGSTYVVGSRDVGREISVRVTGSKVSYLSTVRESTRTSAVTR